MSTELKQKELRKYIVEEKLQMLAILETHLKTKNIAKIVNSVFGSWNWLSNVDQSPTSCRIIVGWNNQVVKVMVLHVSKQSVLCLVETIPDKIKFYASIVIMGDFNVTLKPEEHSNGGSASNMDMHEFSDLVNAVEVEDLSTQYSRAHGVFLPYLISDHSPGVLIFPEGLPKKVKSFRFTNYIADKQEFLDVVPRLDPQIHDDSLQVAQEEIDKDPFNEDKKKKAITILEEYTEVSKDELKLLHQKVKINWLREGDKNIAYFHNILKARKHKNRVESICDDNGVRFWGDDVAIHFERHF
ncbi:RNA-directed DNA polymerase, eukaryota, reverse transcriptase zinc-binding domain protein [Tanacetum coccineum]